MRYLILIVAGCIIISNVYAQDQVRVRFGAAMSLKSDKSNGLHMSGNSTTPLPSGIGLEYYRPLQKINAGLITGAFVEAQRYGGRINTKQFMPGIVGLGYGSQYASVKLYAGLEKAVVKSKHSSANDISILGGAALGINAIGVGGKQIANEQTGITNNGGNYRGKYLNDPGGALNGAYYFIVDGRAAHTFTPDVFAGVRWNITNKAAKTVFVVEGIVNYSLMPKVYIDMPYTLNDEPKKDRLKDYGFNTQINVLIPLKTFTGKSR